MPQTALDLFEALKQGKTTVSKVVEDTYAHIEKSDAEIKSFVSLHKKQALADAQKWDAKFKAGDDVPLLAGVPIAIKDNLCETGVTTTCASKILEGYQSPYDATVIKKLKNNGLISIGKANMDEFAMGSSCENSAYFPTRNPWHAEYAPGGSSGGSASSVAAGQVPLSLGSDTGGSIRQPASFCGVTGIKPTYGRVSRYGLVAFASSLDQIGPFAQDVADAAALLEVISGPDSQDSTSENQPVPNFYQSLNTDIKGKKLAVPKSLMTDPVDPKVIEAVEKALDTYRSLGATVEEVDLGFFEAGVSTYYILAPAEASANLSRFDGVRFGYRADGAQTLRDMYVKTRGQGFGPEVQRRILIGTHVLSAGYYDAYYGKAQKARVWIKDSFEKLFSDFDAVISPTSPTLPFKLNTDMDNPLTKYLADLATIPANLAGIPGMSIPCGFADGLPIGLQILTPRWDEQTMLNLGQAFQEATDFHTQHPAQMANWEVAS